MEETEIMVKQQNEIERQKIIIRQLDIKNLELSTIIKEVREYIKDNFLNLDGSIWHEDMKKILEILDKVGDEK